MMLKHKGLILAFRNKQIRERILNNENELTVGDFLMVVKNNYFWLKDAPKVGFIANGDIAEVMRIGNIEEMYGLRFLDATLRLVDYPQLQPIEIKMLLDTINAESPALTRTEQRQFFERVMEDYAEIGSKKKRMELLRQTQWSYSRKSISIKYVYNTGRFILECRWRRSRELWCNAYE